MDPEIRVGWKEKVQFPRWSMTLKALLDPSAPLSTLAVERVEVMGRMRDEEGRRRLVLRLAVPVAQGKSRVKRVHAFYHRRTRLGEVPGRQYVVKIPLRLGETVFEAEVALLPAERRQHFLHLGREALAGRFLVDSSAAYLCRLPVLAPPTDPDPLLPMGETEENIP